MLRVLLTIDVELWPNDPYWPDRALSHPLKGLDAAYQRDVLGHTEFGDYGLPFILKTLHRHDLRGVFFVEPLSSCVTGIAQLKRTVRAIQDAGQEVQLHPHTEWLSEAAAPSGVPSTYRQNLGDFTLVEQTATIRYGLELLRAAGVHTVTALRAGNLGGNRDTPAAACAAGLALDLSFSQERGARICALKEAMRDRTDRVRVCPILPLSVVEDYPGHYRPAQLTAISFRELRRALVAAATQHWPHFVILTHSFELVHRPSHRFRPLHPHLINLARWNKLCSFLARHRDSFVTVGCKEMESNAALVNLPTPSRTLPWDTAHRWGEQFVSQFV